MPHGVTQSWILVITELHRYQGVGYKSDIVVISGIVNKVKNTFYGIRYLYKIHEREGLQESVERI